jgi:hypothetical protein
VSEVAIQDFGNAGIVAICVGFIVHNDLNAMIEIVARPRLCLPKLHGGRNMIDDEASTFAGTEDSPRTQI